MFLENSRQCAGTRSRLRLQLELDILFQRPSQMVGNRRSAFRCDGESQGHWLLARLDAREDMRCRLAGCVGMEQVARVDCLPRRHAGPLALHDGLNGVVAGLCTDLGIVEQLADY